MRDKNRDGGSLAGGGGGGSQQPFRQYKFHNVFSDNVLMGPSRRRQKGEGEGMLRGLVRVNDRRLLRKEEEELQSRVDADDRGRQGFLQSQTQLAMAHRLLQGMAVLNEEAGRSRWEVERGGDEVEKEMEETPSRRERKPRKDDICHIQQQSETADGREEVKKEVAEDPSPSPLDLSQPRFPAHSSPPPMAPPSPSLALVLQPPEYEALAPHHPLYATYIFLPSLGVFVHPLALPPELAPQPPMPHRHSPLGTKCTLATFTNNNRSEASTNMIATNQTEAGGGATFCTFKNVKTVASRKSSGEKDHHKSLI